MPKTIPVSQIQKRYRQIFNRVKKTKEPVIVLSGNKPDVAIIDYQSLESMRHRLYEIEIKDALATIEEGEKELRMGKTKKAKSLTEFLK